MLEKIKKVGKTSVILLFIAGLVIIYIMSQNWTIRFHSQLDKFFGKGNWECISGETKTSHMYSEYINTGDTVTSGETPGKYKNWYIAFQDKNGEEELCNITNHVFKISADEHWIFSSKRYSQKQALTLELMDVSFDIIGNEILDTVIKSELSEEEASCIEVTMLYHGGNPQPKFYTALAKEDWFNINDVSAENYLSYDLHDFYLYIRAHDYRLEKLTDEQQQNVLNSMERIEQKLLETYGENASFQIYFDSEHKVEYVDGEKVS